MFIFQSTIVLLISVIVINLTISGIIFLIADTIPKKIIERRKLKSLKIKENKYE